MTNKNNDELESLENENLAEEIVEEKKVEHTSIPPVAKYTRPPAFIKGNTFSRGNQSNITKQVQRKSSGRGR
ncbi:MAG: hypothetical protein PHH98_00120 [Candidatus Gracilibacteria bacterium]|nr:hypothetical protein [Candidatus Gracilibacteria bacterium]